MYFCPEPEHAFFNPCPPLLFVQSMPFCTSPILPLSTISFPLNVYPPWDNGNTVLTMQRFKKKCIKGIFCSCMYHSVNQGSFLRFSWLTVNDQITFLRSTIHTSSSKFVHPLEDQRLVHYLIYSDQYGMKSLVVFLAYAPKPPTTKWFKP